jgi:hypothetical protein
MKKAFFIILISFMARLVMGQEYTLRVDTDAPDEKLRPLTFLEGATPLLDVYQRSNGSKYTNLTDKTAEFFYGTSPTAPAFVIVTNDSINTADGYFRFNFDSIETATNGVFWYTVLMKQNGNTYFSGTGTVEIIESTVTGSPSALDLQTPLNWNGYTYINSISDGPYLAGSNITFRASGTNGQLFIDGSASANGFLKLDGSTPMEADLPLGSNNITDVTEIHLLGQETLTASEGVLGYDSTHHALAYKTDIADVTLNPSLEDARRVYNNNGATITNGVPVYMTGTTNINGHSIETVSIADASDPTKLAIIGIATHDISVGSEGWVVPRGKVHDVDMTSSSVNDKLFVSDGGGLPSSTPGTFAINVGQCVAAGATGAVYADIGNWQADGKTERVSTALSVQRHSLYITNVAGQVYSETELIGGGDMIYRFGGIDYTLDCTTGGGTGGRARSGALTVGSDTVPTLNYLYVVPGAWPNCFLTNSITHPNGNEYAWVGQVTLQSAAATLTAGPLALQRKTEAFQHNGRGRISYISERIRALGAQWADVGCEATITDDAGGNVTLAVSGGIVYQMHRQTYPAFADPATIYLVNDPDTAYNQITNFNQLTKDASGASIANRRYVGVRIIGYVASGDDGQSRVFAQLPTGVYSTEANAIADSGAYDVNSMPSFLKGGSFNIARIILYKNNSGTWSHIATQDKRGELLNALGSGGGASTSTEFSDATFRIQDNSDATKEIAFEASRITTATTRTLTMPDRDLDLGNPTFDTITMLGDISMSLQDITGVGGVQYGINGGILWTADDNDFIGLFGGATNSGSILLYGGDHATSPGDIWLTPQGSGKVEVQGTLNMTNNPITSVSSVTFQTNSTSHSSGTLNGTNGVFYTQNGTNYWILFN